MDYLKDKRKIWAIIAFIILAAITTVVAFKTGVNPPMGSVYGQIGALVAAVIVCTWLKAPLDLFYIAIGFVYFASPVGSVLNLYRSVDPYDKVVHFFSGILIAAFSYMIIWKLVKKNHFDKNDYGKLIGISALFAMIGAGTGSGIWEIMEFLMDIITSGEMQRGMVDTITDMIAGDLGGICYGLAMLVAGKIRYNK